MAVTYADLVAFGFAYVENNISTNLKGSKLTVKTRSAPPLLRPGDACLCQEEDFILVAEFSEIKGPTALLTIPSHLQHGNAIDINSFIMRIMSVDYQANPWGQFRICQDTQVLQTFVSHNRHAYVHYFTLYDLHARGFVRPMCLAYVCMDHRKLHRLFPKMRKYFMEITDLIKVGNRLQFRNEISSILSAIKNLNGVKFEDEGNFNCPTTSHGNENSPQAEQLMHQYNDFQNMLQAVESSLVDTDFAEATLNHWCAALTLGDDVNTPGEIKLYLKTIASWKFRCFTPLKFNDGGWILDKQLRPMPALSPWGVACALWHLSHALKMFSHCELSTSLGGFTSLSSAQYDTDSIHGYGDSLSAFEALNHFEFLHLIEALTQGSSEASTLKEVESDCEHRSTIEGTSGNEGSSSYHSFSDSADKSYNSMCMNNGNPDGNIGALCNGSVIPSESFQTESCCKSSQVESSCATNDESPYLTASLSREDYHSVLDSCSTMLSINSQSSDKVSSSATVTNISESMNSNPVCDVENDSSSTDSESFHDILEAVHGDDNWSQGSSDIELPHGVTWNHCVWTQYRPLSKPGHRLLQFFWTFRSAAQHVIYSLLMGRTLVLAGNAKSERRVSRIMNALIPLIPPLDKGGLRVLRWHQGILVSAHIASYQLIGMCVPERLSVHDMISPRDKNSVSILDVNTEQLLGPAYHGQLLAAMGNNIRDFPSDHTVLLFVQSVLCGVGCKLQSYKALVSSCNSELPSHVCRQLDLHGCDADVIRYLSKLPF